MRVPDGVRLARAVCDEMDVDKKAKKAKRDAAKKKREQEALDRKREDDGLSGRRASDLSVSSSGSARRRRRRRSRRRRPNGAAVAGRNNEPAKGQAAKIKRQGLVEGVPEAPAAVWKWRGHLPAARFV